MAVWGALGILLLIAGCSVNAEHRATFPELAREYGGASRIVSGWEAKEGEIPYQLSLRMVNPLGRVFACGATLIHNEWALTAAHCTANRVTMVVRAGTTNMTRPEVIFETTDYYNHPLYNEANQGVVQPNDIGLLRLNRYVEYTDLIQPIRLQSSYDRNKNYDGIRLQASGWGNTWTQGTSPENLNWVFLLGTSNAACFSNYGALIVDSTICANAYNVSSQSTCQGDSGGPLVVVDYDGELSQVGISSFVSGTGCHTPFPAGFIRPGHYHEWYFEVTGINFDWEPTVQTTTVAPEDSSEEQETTTTESTETEESSEEVVE